MSCSVFRISRSAKPKFDIASVLNNIDVNDMENLHLLNESNNTDATDIKQVANDNEIVEKITERPSARNVPMPKEEAKNCFIFDEETFELVNLCPNST